MKVPDSTQEAIWNAVQAAVAAGVTPKQFKEEAAEAWEQILREAAKDAIAELNK